jgi:hypothetical protein
MDCRRLEERHLLDKTMMKVLLAGGLLLVCAAAPETVTLRADDCAPMGAAMLESLGPSWHAFMPFVQSCAVHAPDGTVPLTVVTVRIDLGAAAGSSAKMPDAEAPSPVIRDRQSHVVGELPESFPIDPPGELKVSFMDWRNGVLWQIELYEAGESAVPPHTLPPLYWHADVAHYLAGK